MKIQGIVWAGTKTKNYEGTVAFFRDVLGIQVREAVPDVTVFEFPNGDLFEVIGPSQAPEMDVVTGPKVDFLVTDVDEAVAELSAKGCKFVGPVYRATIQNWANYYAPDGNLYGITDLFIHPLHQQTPQRILFYGPHEPYGYLGNWYPAALFLKDKIWPTSEHYYQAQKMAGSKYEEICRRLGSPRETFEMTRRPEIPIRKDWEQVKAAVMRDAVTAKFTQNPELAERLLATGDAELAENSPVDFYWGIGADGSGQNMLGKILMDVRQQLRAGR